MKKAGLVGILSLLMGLILAVTGSDIAAQDVLLQPVGSFELNGNPERIDVICAGANCQRQQELVYYDAQINSIRFIDLRSQSANATVAVGSAGFDQYLAIDRFHKVVYSLGEDTICKNGFDFDCYEAAFAHIIGGHERRGVANLNKLFDEQATGSLTPRYDIAGFQLRSGSVFNHQPRLFVHDAIKHNIDIIDINLFADNNSELTTTQYRHSYRAPERCYNQQSCSWNPPDGDSLAIERTTAGEALYVVDGGVRAIGVTDDGIIGSGAEVDFLDQWPFPNGVDTLAMGADNQLVVIPNSGDFDNGYVGFVNTLTKKLDHSERILYPQESVVEVDWLYGRRSFALSNDAFDYDPSDSLLLHLFYDGQLRESVAVHAQYAGGQLDMAFEPHTRKLYVLSDTTVYIYQVNIGAGAAMVQLPDVEFEVDGNRAESIEVPDGSARLGFFSNAFSEDARVHYREVASVAPRAEQRLLAARIFELSAETITTATPITDFGGFNVEIRLSYTDSEITPLDEGALKLYRYVDGAWVLRGGTVSAENNTLTTMLNEPGTYALMAPAYQLYIPLVER